MTTEYDLSGDAFADRIIIPFQVFSETSRTFRVKQLVKKQLQFFTSLILKIEFVRDLLKNVKATKEGLKKG